MITGFDKELSDNYSRHMNLQEWADKFAAGIKDWVDSVADMFEVDLGDADDNEEA
jgi:hypothetical protein